MSATALTSARAHGVSADRRARIALLGPGVVGVLVFLGCLTSIAYLSLLPGATIGATADVPLGAGSYAKFLGDGFNLAYLVRSFRIAAYCTVISLVLGYVIAYFMAMSGPTVRVIVSIVILVQFFTTYVIRTYALMLLLSRTGFVNTTLLGLGLIEQPLSLLFSEFAVAIGLIAISTPLAVFPIYSSLSAIAPAVKEAAAALGANRFAVFREVVWPLSLPGVLASGVLLLLFDLTAYVTPSLLGGGRFDMLANLIYKRAMHAQDYSFAAAVAMVALAATLCVAYGVQKVAGRAIRGGTR